MDVNEKLKILGYDKRWLAYGFLTDSELENQFASYLKAVNDPNSKEAEMGHQHPEHLRHGLFLKIAESKSSFTDIELMQLIELVQCDKDPGMAKKFYTYVVDQNNLSQDQIDKFPELKEAVN